MRPSLHAISAHLDRFLLEQAGGAMRNFVRLRACFLHLHRDLAAYRKGRLEYLVQPYPASTVVGVTELVPGGQLEVEAAAVV